MIKLDLLRLMYPSGTRIKLIKMNDPPETDPLPPGLSEPSTTWMMVASCKCAGTAADLWL